MRNDNPKRWLIPTLVAVIVILGALVLWAFVLRPAVSGYVVNGYNTGAQDAILSIAQKAAQCQQVPITVGNQTINLVAVECLQQAQQNSQ